MLYTQAKTTAPITTMKAMIGTGMPRMLPK